ncbi:hypothetical protein C8J57DRAFT_1590517 [Mycena rebaudengoi]|nr:hypothetical protein C8J57DRAFT_1590517 [Mycena rebaudengoi]
MISRSSVSCPMASASALLTLLLSELDAVPERASMSAAQDHSAACTPGVEEQRHKRRRGCDDTDPLLQRFELPPASPAAPPIPRHLYVAALRQRLAHAS